MHGAKSRRITLALMLGFLAITLPACSQVESAETDYSPTEVKPIPGREEQQVTFNAEAVRRAGIKTAHVRATRGHTFIPYAALIYNENGDTYTYVSPKPRVYLREPISVDHIAGGRVVLKRGPIVGTEVVTTGAAEVYSAEFGVEE
jgi:multidrug efflux pump subunit AcrA (membrane-fusion protein)